MVYQAEGFIESLNKIIWVPSERGAKIQAEIGVVIRCNTSHMGFLLILYLTSNKT